MFKRPVALALLASTAVLFASASLPAHAQKPALTQNIDEKGRVPYQQSVVAHCSVSDYSCEPSFPPVPVGYRLVVTYFSVFIQSPQAHPGMYALLSGQSPLPNGASGSLAAIFLPMTATGLVDGNYDYFLNAPITCYFNAGEQPLVILDNTFASYASVDLIGYLVAVG